jgi:hypothetical protein
MSIFTDEHLAKIGKAAISYMAAKEVFEHYKVFEQNPKIEEMSRLAIDYHTAYRNMRDAMVEGII